MRLLKSILGLVAIAASNALGLMAPLVLRRAINRIEHGGGAELLVWDAVLIVLLAVGSGIFRFIVRRTVIWASRKIEFDLRGGAMAVHIPKWRQVAQKSFALDEW